MPRSEPVGAIRQPSNSVSGADDRLKFIQCVDGRQPKTHEVWNFGNDGITPEVHPFSRIDVGAFVRDYFATNHLTENGRRVPMLGKN